MHEVLIECKSMSSGNSYIYMHMGSASPREQHLCFLPHCPPWAQNGRGEGVRKSVLGM